MKTEFENYINSIELQAVTNSIEIPEYYQTRLDIAKDRITNTESSKSFRPVSAPAFLNDLGVRKFDDPSMSFLDILKKVKFDPFSHAALYRDLDSLSGSELGRYLDAYILVTGDYDRLYEWAVKNIEGLFNTGSYSTLIYLGGLFAAEKDDRATKFFDQAMDSDEIIERKIVALHRKIAYLVKRTDTDPSPYFFDMLTLIERIPSVVNRNVYYALSDNLYALVATKQGAPKQFIYQLLFSAESLIDSFLALQTNNEMVELVSEAKRYRGQVEINLANILFYDGKINESLNTLASNLKYAEKENQDYVPEANATYAYILYKTGVSTNLDESVKFAKRAVKEYEQIGALHSANNARKTLIAGLYKTGAEKSAEIELKKYNDQNEEI